METINVWTDGSCINNGNLGAVCGIGIFYSELNNKNVSMCLPTGRQTNNRAELCAIMYVLCTNQGSKNITIYTDSKYSIDCITIYSHKWERDGYITSKGTPVEWSNILKYIRTLISSRTEKGAITSLVHVRAHADNINNNIADSLAKAGAVMVHKSSTMRFLEEVCKVPFS